MAPTHTASNNQVTHSRSSSASSHRVPVPPLIPISHLRQGSDVFSPFICPTHKPFSSSYNEKIEAASAAINASLFPAEKNLSNPKDTNPDASLATPMRNISSTDISKTGHNEDLPNVNDPSYIPTSNSENVISQKVYEAAAAQRIKFALPSPPVQAYHTRLPSSRNNLNNQGSQHYRVHSAGGEGYQNDKMILMPHYAGATFANQNGILQVQPATRLGAFVEAVLSLVEAFGALIARCYAGLTLAFRSTYDALSAKLAKVQIRYRHNAEGLTPSKEDRTKLSDAIEDSYIPVAMPSNLGVRINTAECGAVEIEFGTINGERGIEIPYQIYRKTGDFDEVIKADILYLQDGPFTSSTIPPFVASFIREGYRLIIPHLNVADSGCLFGSTGHSTDVGRKARLAADIVQKVRAKDTSDRAAIMKVKIENQRLAKSKADHDKMTEAQKIKQAANGSAELPGLVTATLPGRARASLIDLEPLSTHLPMFLLGLGHSALIALTYPIDNMSPSGFPYKSSPSAYSFPSLSVRAEPSETLLSKLNSFRGSISSGLSGTGWWARDPNGDGTAKTHSRSDSKELKRADEVSVSGIIAIGPTLDPNHAVKSSNVFVRLTRRPHKLPIGVGPTTYLPSIKSAIEKLHLNARKIRIPVMIAHGTKEAYPCIAGINSLYESLASPDCTLIFCPTLRHNANLTSDAARSGLAAESLAWMSQRRFPEDANNQVKLLGQGAGTINRKLIGASHPPLARHPSAVRTNDSRMSTCLEVIPESIQDRFESSRKTSVETDRSQHIRCSSSLSQNLQHVLSNTADDGFLEELREEPKNRVSTFLGLAVSMPSRSPSPSSSHYYSNRYSTPIGAHSRESSYGSCQQGLKPSFDSSRRNSHDMLGLPFAKSHEPLMFDSRSHSPTPSSVVSSPGPLTPSGDAFPESIALSYPVTTKGNDNSTRDKLRISGTNGLSNSIITRPSIDSLCIEIPGSSLGITY